MRLLCVRARDSVCGSCVRACACDSVCVRAQLSAAVATRWLSLLSGIGWYMLSRRLSTRACMLLSMALCLLSCLACAVMYTAFDFWVPSPLNPNP